MMTELPSGASGQPAAKGRILVLLDGSRVGYVVLDVAAAIAARTGAELQGVFVEEQNLLRSAGYGFAREVGSVSGVSRPLDVTALEQRMQRLAEQSRRALAGAAGHYGGRYQLSIARGSVVEEVLALAEPEDLLVLGRARWSTIPAGWLGSTARALLHRSPGRLLLWSHQQPPNHGRVVVFLNEHEGANQRAIAAAAEAAAYSRQPVTLLLSGEAGVAPDALATLKRNLGVPEPDVRVVPLPSSDPATVARVLRQEKASQLVLSRDCSLFREPGAENLLAALHLPLNITP